MKNDLYLFGPLCYSDIFKCISFLIAHLPFPTHLNIGTVQNPEWECQHIKAKPNPDEWWCSTLNQLSAWATIVAVICVSDQTHSTNCLGDQYTLLQYVTIGYIPKDFCQAPELQARILIGLITCNLNGAKTSDKAWYNVKYMVLSAVRNIDITGSINKWNWGDDEFCWQCYPQFTAMVRNYLDQDIFDAVSHNSHMMCEMLKVVPIGHSTFQQLQNKSHPLV